MSSGLGIETFLRISSISVASYNFLATLPVEWRMYRSHGGIKFSWSASRVLFILIRYISITVLTVSNVGYFHHGFSQETCSRYYMVAPVFKVIQMMISQIIIGYRTWTIARRSADMGIFLLCFGFMITLLQWYSNLAFRVPVQKDGNCEPGNLSGYIPQWVFYLLAMLFDATTITISSFFLIKSAGGFNKMSSILKMLFYDGLGYIFVLTATNVLNLILFRNSVGSDVQNSGASFGYMVIWIMSQNILIHIHEAAETRAQLGHIFGPWGRDTVQNFRPGKDYENRDSHLGVQVEIEHAVTVDYDLKTSRKPRVFHLDRKRSDIISGNIPSVDQDQWELSGVTKTASAV